MVPPEGQGSLHLQGSRSEGQRTRAIIGGKRRRRLPVGWFCVQEKVASETLPLLGFTVKLPDGRPSEEEEASVFQLYHKSTLYYTFKAADNHTAQR